MPLYVMPMLGVSRLIFCTVLSSTCGSQVEAAAQARVGCWQADYLSAAMVLQPYNAEPYTQTPQGSPTHTSARRSMKAPPPRPTRMDGSFFSVASTTPFVARMPSEVAPAFTAFSAYSICTSLPLGLKVVSEKE